MEAGWGIADFVEKAPKCVMLMFPHHPPRLAQLSGVFVVCSTKNSQFVSTHEPMAMSLLDEAGFIDKCICDI